jgi:hypothetical protein
MSMWTNHPTQSWCNPLAAVCMVVVAVVVVVAVELEVEWGQVLA